MADSVEEESALSHTRDVVEGRKPLDATVLAEFDVLVRQHAGRIFHVCWRITRDVETARELQQDALATAYQKLPEFDRRSSLSTWVCGIARNLALNRIRRREELLSEDGVVEPADPEESVLRSLSRAEREHVMREATACLPELEQRVVHLRYVENLDRAHIAGWLELPGPDDVRRILQNANRRLKPELERRLRELGHGLSFVVSRDRTDER